MSILIVNNNQHIISKSKTLTEQITLILKVYPKDCKVALIIR